MNFQDPGQPKPGAVVLVDADSDERGGARFPLLTIQNYGRGRTAVFATGGSWRWQMLQPVADKSHEMFYPQLLRWLVNDTPRAVIASTPRQLLDDETQCEAAGRSSRQGVFSCRRTRRWRRTFWGRTGSPKPSRCGRIHWSRASTRRIGPRPSRDRM